MALDLLLINPGERGQIYQSLGNSLTAIEPPLWCRLIGGHIRDQGYSIRILDAEAEELSADQVADIVAQTQPLLIAMVVFGHQPSASTQQMVGAGLTCRAIKARWPESKIIILGGHVSALPERTLREEAVDFACNSEGPVTVRQLLEQLKSESFTPHAVEGLVFHDGDQVVNVPAPALIKDLDKELHGQVWDLLPMSKYRAHNWQCFGDLDSRQPYASIYTSLGCPYKCSFCCINAPFGTNRYRMRSPEGVVDEIQHLYETYGVRTFKFIDEMFVLNDKHVTKICDLLMERGLGPHLNIWAYARIDTVKPERLAKLRGAGIKWLALGIESGSEHVRDGAEKSFNQQDILEIVRAIQSAGIHVIGNYIFGLPDDDLASMRATLDLAMELNCEFANFYSAMAYPGSPLYELAVNSGWALPESWSGFSQHSYDCTPLPTEKVSAADVLSFRDEAFHRYFANPRYLDLLTQQFGWETRHHVEAMSAHRLSRKILEKQ